MTARLVIDSAGAACSLALFDGPELLGASHQVIGRGHAEQLVPALAELPGGGRADQIWVGIGPGSFTGVRVGIAAARGLGLAWNVPVLGFASLALVAVTAAGTLGGGGQPLLVAVDGGHGQYFVQPFGPDGAALAPVQSLVPDAAIAIGSDIAAVVGNRAADFVRLRGWGSGHDALGDCRAALALHPSQCGLPPLPDYGRAPDARPA